MYMRCHSWCDRNRYEKEYDILYFIPISYIFRIFFVLLEVFSYFSGGFRIFFVIFSLVFRMCFVVVKLFRIHFVFSRVLFRISYFYTTTWLFVISWCKFEKRRARNSLFRRHRMRIHRLSGFAKRHTTS